MDYSHEIYDNFYHIDLSNFIKYYSSVLNKLSGFPEEDISGINEIYQHIKIFYELIYNFSCCYFQNQKPRPSKEYFQSFIYEDNRLSQAIDYEEEI